MDLNLIPVSLIDQSHPRCSTKLRHTPRCLQNQIAPAVVRVLKIEAVVGVDKAPKVQVVAVVSRIPQAEVMTMVGVALSEADSLSNQCD